MKTVQVTINKKSTPITYSVEDTNKGKRFKVTDIPEELKMGSEYEFGAWESNNVYEIPKLADADGDNNKWDIVNAIFDAENIDYQP